MRPKDVWPSKLLPNSFLLPFSHPFGRCEGNKTTTWLLIAGNLNLQNGCTDILWLNVAACLWAEAGTHVSIKNLAIFGSVSNLVHDPTINALLISSTRNTSPCHSQRCISVEDESWHHSLILPYCVPSPLSLGESPLPHPQGECKLHHMLLISATVIGSQLPLPPTCTIKMGAEHSATFQK